MKKAATIIFAIPLLAFGLGHLTNADQMADMIPSWMPFGIAWVYLTGLALLAAGVSFIINKQVALAGKLLAVMLVIFIAAIHIPSMMAGDQMGMPSVFKDLGLAGAALYFAANAES